MVYNNILMARIMGNMEIHSHIQSFDPVPRKPANQSSILLSMALVPPRIDVDVFVRSCKSGSAKEYMLSNGPTCRNYIGMSPENWMLAQLIQL